MPHMVMQHDIKPDVSILERVGSLDDIEVFNNQVLLGVYMRPKDAKTKGGLHLPQMVTDEDRFQSKVGLLLKTGASAFKDDKGEWFAGVEFKPTVDWLVFRPSDGWAITINGVLCRMFEDVQIRGRVAHCDVAW